MSPIEEKPSRNEDEYFVKMDAELIKQQRAKLDADREKAQRAAHRNKCPKCGCDLREIEFHHVKIDECPECHGMWFDKGELEMVTQVDRNEVRGFLRRMLGLRD